MSQLTIHAPRTGLSTVCAPILLALPSWFGIEEANREYIAFIENHPTLLATINDQVLGFLSLKQHFPESAEIHVMAVLPDHHRRGIGRALVTAAEDHLRDQGMRFLQVKTLSSAHPDTGYARTRAFYQGIGFVPLEEFPEIWGAANPALQLIKSLG